MRGLRQVPPDLARGAVLSELPLFSVDPDAGQALMSDLGPRVGEAIDAGAPTAFIDAFYAAVCPGLWATLDEDGRDSYRVNGEIGLIDLQSPPFHLTTEDLADVDVPVLMMSGDRSHPSLRAVAPRIAAAHARRPLRRARGVWARDLR